MAVFVDGVLQVSCPHCNAVEDDDLEVLESNRPLQLRCGLCSQAFSMLIRECALCSQETVHTWRDAQSNRSALDCTTCSLCMKLPRSHEPASTLYAH
jgi:transcription elongation factor Elf1